MHEPQHLPFNEGLSTRPDVDLLLRTWPDPQELDRFEYATIEKLIGASSKSDRFWTVTSNWRKRMLERGYVIYCDGRSKSFFVANAAQIAASSYGALSSIRRKAHKQRRHLVVAKPITDLQRMEIEHHGRLFLAVEHDAKKARMNLIAPPPVPGAPQIGPPKNIGKQ